MKKRSFSQLLSNVGRATEVAQCILMTRQWWPLTRAYLGLKDLDYPFHFTSRRGQKVVINTFHDLVTVWVIFFRGEYKIPEDSRIVIDAGANIGTFSIYASDKMVGEIYALEPFPETFQQLERNIKLNNLEDKVQLLPVALADETGQKNMDLGEGPSQSRGLLQAEINGGLAVETKTLEDFMNSIDKKEIDLLKIDIEGGEHQVFHSSSPETLRRIKNIVMEYHPNASKEKLFAKIESARFDLTHDFKISDQSGVAYFERQP